MTSNSLTDQNLTAAEANEILARAMKAAEKESADVAVALVNASGVLAGFLRTPASFLASVDYARWKAWTAASFNMPTADFAAFLQTLDDVTRQGLLAHPDVTALGGGFPIHRNGALVGAIGVSGGDARQDEVIAKAGLQALEG